MAQTFNRNVNIGLKVVGKAVGIDNLQFYQARHTFATLSRNMMKFAKSDVDEALNHVGSYDTIMHENNTTMTFPNENYTFEDIGKKGFAFVLL